MLIAFGCGGSGTKAVMGDGAVDGAGVDGAPDMQGGGPDMHPGGPDVHPGPDAHPGGPDARDAAGDAAPDAGTPDAAPDGAPVDGPVADAPEPPDAQMASTAIAYCSSIPSLAAPPTIDGTLEPGLTLRPIEPEGWNSAAGPLPAGHSSKIALAWRPDSLYVFLEVTDPSPVPARSTEEPYCGDSVEIYLDDDGAFAAPGKYDNPGTRQLVAAAPAADGQPVTRGVSCRQVLGSRCPEWTSTDYRTFAKPNGYVFEAKISANDLALANWALTAAGHIGIDVAINVSHPTNQPEVPGKWWVCPNRLGQYYLRLAVPPYSVDGGADVDKPWANTAAFCTPRLAP